MPAPGGGKWDPCRETAAQPTGRDAAQTAGRVAATPIDSIFDLNIIVGTPLRGGLFSATEWAGYDVQGPEATSESAACPPGGFDTDESRMRVDT